MRARDRDAGDRAPGHDNRGVGGMSGPMPAIPRWTNDAGLLLLRVAVGSMMLFGHGLPKLLEFGDKAARFPDPLGVGSAASLSLAIVGEVLAPALLVLGLGTRAAAAPLLITMGVAALMVHADDPWARKELAVLYAVPALTLMLTGAGRFSVAARVLRTQDEEGKR